MTRCAEEPEKEKEIRSSLARVGLVMILCACVTILPAVSSQDSPQPDTYRQKMRTFHSADDFARLTAGKVRIVRDVHPEHAEKLRDPSAPLPVRDADLTVINADALPSIWIGTRQGALRLRRDSTSREYLAGGRWLPDDHVTGIGVAGDAIWIETGRGFSRIEYRPMTLADKSRVFVDRVQARHNRWGLTADSQLRVAGDLSTNQMASNDNDGLWTAMYVVAECFRYKVSG
jgi:hypothetical protein